MKLSSTSAAKLLLCLSIGIATVSAYKGLEWHRSAESTTNQLRRAEQSELKLKQEAALLAEALPGDEEALPLASTLIEVISALKQGQVRNRVQIGPITTPNAGGSSTADLLQLAKPLDNTELSSLTLQIRGTYKEYAGLRRYLSEIQRHPVALTRLSIAGNTFEIDIKLLGTV